MYTYVCYAYDFYHLDLVDNASDKKKTIKLEAALTYLSCLMSLLLVKSVY